MVRGWIARINAFLQENITGMATVQLFRREEVNFSRFDEVDRKLLRDVLTFHGFETAGTIVWITTKQRLVPPELLGRVSSLDWLISIGLLPLSYALTGPVAAAFGARPTLIGAGLLGAVITLAALYLPGMRAADGEANRGFETGGGALARSGRRAERELSAVG